MSFVDISRQVIVCKDTFNIRDADRNLIAKINQILCEEVCIRYDVAVGDILNKKPEKRLWECISLIECWEYLCDYLRILSARPEREAFRFDLGFVQGRIMAKTSNSTSYPSREISLFSLSITFRPFKKGVACNR